MGKKPEGTFEVNEQLWPLLVDIGTLHEDPDNANSHNGDSYDAIADSYRKFKQQRPIVCNAVGKVIGGNGQLVAARDLLRWTHIAAIKFDSDEEAEQAAFALADNKTAELSSWNWGVLAEQLFNLPDDLAAATGFKPEEIDAIIANSPWEGMPDGDVPGAQSYKGQKFIRLRIREAKDVEPVMSDIKQLIVKYGEGLEVLD